MGSDGASLLGQLLQPAGEGSQELFQQSFVDPAMKALNQEILPGIQQRFGDANAGSSSALNQALSQAATDVTTNIGANYGQYLQGQQNMGLQGLLSLLGQQTFSPLIQEKQGLAGSIIGAGGKMGAAAISSKKAKENIRDYKKSIAVLKDLTVKQYDYKEEFGGLKDRVGFIAEDVPEELTIKKDDILHVDVYGMLGLAVNAIKMLEARVSELEGGE